MDLYDKDYIVFFFKGFGQRRFLGLVGGNWQGSWRCWHLFASSDRTSDMLRTGVTRTLTLATVLSPILVAPSLAFSWASFCSKRSKSPVGKSWKNCFAPPSSSSWWASPLESILPGHGEQLDWSQFAIVTKTSQIVIPKISQVSAVREHLKKGWSYSQSNLIIHWNKDLYLLGRKLYLCYS